MLDLPWLARKERASERVVSFFWTHSIGELERRAGKGHSQGKPRVVLLDPGGNSDHDRFLIYVECRLMNANGNQSFVTEGAGLGCVLSCLSTLAELPVLAA